jgi:hypothetical protein
MHGRLTHSRAGVAVGATLAVLLVVVTLAACGSAAAPAPRNVGKDLSGRPSTPDGWSGTAAGGQQSVDGSLADLAERKIVKKGEFSLQVDDVASSLAQVRALATDLGGYVGGSRAGTLEESATLTLRLPADRFDEALTRLHTLDGKVLGEATSEEDVTSTLVDLDARLLNLEASERQYRALLARAQRVRDILAVQSRLDGVRGEIERLQAQQKQLTGLADLATLSVTLVPEPAPVQQAGEDWDPGATVGNAYAALLDLGQGLASAGIWLAIVGLPLLVVLAVIVLLVLRFVPASRRRLPGRTGP